MNNPHASMPVVRAFARDNHGAIVFALNQVGTS